MAFSIVEFEDGYFNLICTKWLYKDENSLICYWPHMETSEKYFKSVRKLVDLNEEEKWEKAKVTKILSSYGTKIKSIKITED